MKTILIFLLTITTFSLQAQFETTWRDLGSNGFENVWLGGTPGQENEWYQASNWSKHQVPDKSSWVIIRNLNTGHQAFPIIDEDVLIAGIEVHNSATLTIANTGKLMIDGEFANNHGILNFGKIYNEGEIQISNTGLRPILDERNNIQNIGSVAVLDEVGKVEYLVSED